MDQMVEESEAIKVLFIGGWGRSGSTILERMLGQIHGYFPAGEIYNMWQRGFGQNQLCGCRRPFLQCDFWHAVLQEMYRKDLKPEVGELLSLQHYTERLRYLPQLIFPGLRWDGYKKKFEKYSHILSRLYAAIKKVSGCEVVVDSSKEPVHGFILNAMPSIELHMVHLIRDSRAVAYSWQRKRHRPEVYWKQEAMPRYSAIRSAVEWNLRNLTVGLLGNFCRRNIRESYENLVESPHGTLTRIIKDFNHQQNPNFDFLADRMVKLDIHHTVSGNPNRFEAGDIELFTDAEWAAQMPTSAYLTVTALTWPLLLKYGYSLRRLDSAGEAAPK
jgi:hypothetical protein